MGSALTNEVFASVETLLKLFQAFCFLAFKAKLNKIYKYIKPSGRAKQTLIKLKILYIKR